MTDIRLDDDNMKTIITKAVIDSLTPERREAIIAEAVKSLLKASNDRYDQRSNLQKAFDLAVADVARQMAFEELAKDEGIKSKIRELFFAAWEKATADGDARDKLIGNIADSLRRGITGERY